MRQVLGNKKAIAAFLIPALLFYVGVMVVPAVWSIVLSFQTGTPVSGFTFTGLSNYRNLFTDPQASQAFWFTMKFAVVISVLQIVIGYALALLYVFVLKRSSVFIRTMVFFPVVLPTVAVALLFGKFFAISPQEGPINSIIGLFGHEAVDWFSSGNNAFFVIIVMEIWRSMGFFAILLYAGLIEIPEETLDSARIDGAGGWKLVRHIVVPVSLPVLMASVVFALNSSLKVFDTVLALTNGGPAGATRPLNLLMYQTAFQYSNFGYGATLAVSVGFISLVATLLVFRFARRDLTKG